MLVGVATRQSERRLEPLGADVRARGRRNRRSRGSRTARGRAALYRMGRELAACVIERHRRRLHGRARRVTIDLDPTDDQTHGAQQLTFFNGHYGGWCYLPLLAFLTFDREAEQYLCAAVLRPGKAVAAEGDPRPAVSVAPGWDSPPVAPSPPASWAAWAAPPAGLSPPQPSRPSCPPGRRLNPTAPLAVMPFSAVESGPFTNNAG